MMNKEQLISAFSAYADQTLQLSPGTINNYCSCLRGMASTPMGIHAFRNLYAAKSPVAEDYYKNEMLHSIPPSLAVNYIPSCGTAIDTFLKFKHRAPVAQPWDKYSNDPDNKTKWIKYDSIVPKNERVRKLCYTLEEEYARIRAFAKSILCDVMEPEWFTYIPALLTYNEEEVVYQLHKRPKEQPENDPPFHSEEDEKILLSGYYRYRPLASFNPTRPAPIELYFRNVTADSFDAYLSVLKNSLAHEYMHYLHHCLCEKLGNMESYHNEDMAEGLADYFAFAYSVFRNTPEDFLLALRQYTFWATYFNRGIPYAQALYFCPEKKNIHLYPGRFDKLELENGTLKLAQVLKYCNNKLDATISMWDKILP